MVPVTLEEIVASCAGVRRGLKYALLVADLPFGTYQASMEDAVRNAAILLKEGAEAVKLEGASGHAATVRRLTDVGIPVMGHLGLTPQAIHQFGGHRAQGVTARQDAERCGRTRGHWKRQARSAWCWKPSPRPCRADYRDVRIPTDRYRGGSRLRRSGTGLA